ncbi:peptidase C39 [Lachnospiraceae bacterium ZAX-1]
MKTPMQYQMSEFDCGPTTVLNALRFLFECEEMLPETLKYIMLYCLDTYNEKGECGKRGTSKEALVFLSSWLNLFAQMKAFPLVSEFLGDEEVVISPDSRIIDAVIKGGVVVLRVLCEGGHYVLLTGVSGDKLELFDPYYRTQKIESEGVEMFDDSGKGPNRSVTLDAINSEDSFYRMGGFQKREALIIYNTRTQKPQSDSEK